MVKKKKAKRKIKKTSAPYHHKIFEQQRKKQENPKPFQGGGKSHKKEEESETSGLQQEPWKLDVNRSVSSEELEGTISLLEIDTRVKEHWREGRHFHVYYDSKKLSPT